MSSGLEAIVNELKRLQRNGVDRVFVGDETMDLLAASQQSRTSTADDRPAATAPANSAPVDHSGLNELVKPAADPKTQRAPVAAKKPESKPLPPPPAIELPEGDAATQLAWLREKVLTCEVGKANLSEQGKIVFGVGSPTADILFCGEAPGADEALAGEPFVGKAGQLLTKIIAAMELSRDDVYLTNILTWRPQHDKPYGNRPPTIEEMNFCLPYLRAQVEIIQPKVIVALGSATVNGLLGPDPKRKMGEVRGTWASFVDTPVMITFHPSYLVRNGTMKTKRLAWEDMLQVMERCDLEITDKQRGFFLPKN